MPASTEPRSGLYYGWSLGESGWNAQMDANLLRLGRFGFHLSAKDRDLATPPATPATGDTYIIAAAATGAWAGKESQVTIWSGSAWEFGIPRIGWLVYVEDEEIQLIYKSTGWQAVASGSGPLDPELAAIAGLTSAADKGIQFTGSGTAATFDLTAAGRALLDDADAAAQRATLGAEAAGTAASTTAAHIAATDPHGDRGYTDTQDAAHVAAADPHGDRSYAAAQDAAHVAATDPHGDRSYAAAQDAAHVAATDPHPGKYQPLVAVSMPFASFPPASSVPGQRFIASDLAYAELFAQDGEWWPVGGEQTIALSVVPTVALPSGTVAANGVITLDTGLISAARTCWGFLPAGAVVGGLAGFYYMEFTNTVSGTVYTNFNDASGDFFPGVPTGALVAAVGSGAAYTGSTAAIPVFKKTVPGGLMSSKSLLRIAPRVGCINNTNAKTMEVTLGGVVLTTPSLANSAGKILSWILGNLGKTNANIKTIGANGELNTSGGFSTDTIDTSVDLIASISFANTVATDWVGLYGCSLLLIGAPA